MTTIYNSTHTRTHSITLFGPVNRLRYTYFFPRGLTLHARTQTSLRSVCETREDLSPKNLIFQRPAVTVTHQSHMERNSSETGKVYVPPLTFYFVSCLFFIGTTPAICEPWFPTTRNLILLLLVQCFVST